jgi:hypothetical protein
MKRTTPAASAATSSPGLIASAANAAIADFDALRERRKRLDEAVDDALSQIATSERELAMMRTALAAKETDIILIEDAKLPALEKEMEQLANAVDSKDLAVRRFKARIEALEAKAPEIDAQVDEAICRMRTEASLTAQDLQAELAIEIRENVASLQRIYSKVRKLQQLVPTLRTSDFLVSAYVPDLDICMRALTGSGNEYQDMAPNLLAAKDAATEQAEAEIAARMSNFGAALQSARMYQPYVAIAKRPKPYVFKGSNEGPSRGLGGPIGEPAPPPRMIEEKTAFNGYKANAPYEIKGDMSGRRTREAALEMDMGRAIMQAAASAAHSGG